jgi:uncharacterized membrane protein HdeD (DUF308 family)
MFIWTIGDVFQITLFGLGLIAVGVVYIMAELENRRKK